MRRLCADIFRLLRDARGAFLDVLRGGRLVFDAAGDVRDGFGDLVRGLRTLFGARRELFARGCDLLRLVLDVCEQAVELLAHLLEAVRELADLVGAAEMTHHCVPSTSNGVATEKNDVPSGIFHVPEACAFELIASAKSLLRAGSIGSSLNCGIVGCEMFMTPTRSGTLL